MSQRFWIFLSIPVLIFVGILLSPVSEDAQQIKRLDTLRLDDMVEYKIEYTSEKTLQRFSRQQVEAQIVEYKLARGARNTYIYVLNLDTPLDLARIDIGANTARSDGYYVAQVHSPVFATPYRFHNNEPYFLFSSTQRVPKDLFQIDLLVKTASADTLTRIAFPDTMVESD